MRDDVERDSAKDSGRGLLYLGDRDSAAVSFNKDFTVSAMLSGEARWNRRQVKLTNSSAYLCWRP